MFKISTKTDYGVLLMSTLAIKKLEGRQYVALDEIAREKKLPLKYLSQIISALKRSGLVESREGRSGGYKIALAPEKISILSIVEATEGAIEPVRCCTRGKKCAAETHCTIKNTWKSAQGLLTTFLQERTLADTL